MNESSSSSSSIEYRQHMSLTPSIQKCCVQRGDGKNSVEFFPIRCEASTAVWQNFGVATARKRCGDAASVVSHVVVFTFVAVAVDGALGSGWSLVVLEQTASVSQALCFHACSGTPSRL